MHVVIDPYRYRIGKFHKLLQFIFKLLPDADLTIYLDVNAKKLISRKNVPPGGSLAIDICAPRLHDNTALHEA